MRTQKHLMLLQTERSTITRREGFLWRFALRLSIQFFSVHFLKEKGRIPILLLVRQASPTLKEGNSNLVFEVSTFVSFTISNLFRCVSGKGTSTHPPTPRKETVLPIFKLLSYMASTSIYLSKDLFERGDFLCLRSNPFFLKKKIQLIHIQEFF